MRKENRAFYINKKTINKINEIKNVESLKTNGEVIEFLVEYYEDAGGQESMSEVVLKKLSFIDFNIQYIDRMIEMLLNGLNIEPELKIDYKTDYKTIVKNEVKDEIRKRQMKYRNRGY